MKISAVLSFLVLACWLVYANCPPGDVFQPDGGFWCTWNPDFTCYPTGECVSACDPYPCADIVARETTARTAKTKQGKPAVIRLVVHTENTAVLKGPHVWFLRDPDSGKMALGGKIRGLTMGLKLTARVTQLEKALADQIAGRCCAVAPSKK